MKKLLSKPFVLPFCLAILYITVLILGAFAISIYPIYRQELFFVEQAKTIAREHVEGVDDTLQSLIGANMYMLIYDGDGKCIRHIASNKTSPDISPIISLENDLTRALGGETFFHPAFSQVRKRPYSSIVVVAGAPIVDGNSVVGAVFLIKNLMDLPEAIIGYVCYFTIFYWLSAYFIVTNIRKNKKLDELRQNYIANVTHALKTPVASIKALSETLCDGVEPDPDRQKVYYGMILQEANRQDHMIRDVLELSKLQSNGMDFTKSKLRASDILEPITNKYVTLCDCMDINLNISEDIAALPPLYTNAACVRQILEILLDNAVKFAPEDGNIWLDVTHSKSLATFCVRDDGIGIEKNALPQVFDRFFKGNHDFNASGSGLGLAIAKELTAGLKERIWVESQPGKGAAFFFTVHLK